MQTLLVLVGVPGSGKSTVAEELRQASWACINQDTLGDRKRCEAECWRALGQGLDVVIDRCNHTRQQRATWLQLAQDMQRRTGRPLQLLCLALETPPGECVRRAAQRTAHATLSGADAPAVIDRFLAEYQPPTAREGFHQVFKAATPDQAHAVLHTHLLPLRGAGGWVVQRQQQQQQQYRPAQPPRQQQPQQGWAQPASAANGAGPWQQAPQQAARGFGGGSGGAAAAAGQATGNAFEGLWRVMSQQPAQAVATYHPQQAVANGTWQRGYAASAYQGPPGVRQPLQQQPASQGQQGQGGAAAVDAGQPGSRQATPPPAIDGAPPANPSRQAARSSSPKPAYCPPHRRTPQPGQLAQQWQGGPAGNVVPFGKSPGGGPASPRGGPGPGPATRQRFLDEGEDPRPILLWDLNGTLTSHTHARRSTGRNKPRPGTHLLRRLASKFRLGIFTSASKKTVDVALAMLEEAAGAGPPVFERSLVLHRVHTQPVSQEHIAAGGKPWDTVKPLHRYFGKLHRVVLMDDDAYKALPTEKGNMVHVPCWVNEDPSDGMVHHFVEVLLQTLAALPHDADVRAHTAAVSEMLHSIAGRLAEEQQLAASGGVTSGQQANGEEIELVEEGEQQQQEQGGQLGQAEVAAASNPEEIELGDE